nr:MAG TPA: hypothetical protein [Caudoviricetes sp.]
MKKIKRYIIYLRLWFIKRMGYKLPSLREASFVVPGQLYDHFAYIVRAVPRKEKEKELLQCYHCDFHRKGIPCNFCHKMVNGNDICDKHVFEIICKNTDNI